MKGDQVLLIKRGKDPGKGEWNLPGGLVEIGEPLTEAVKREVREETGLGVRVETLLEVAERIIRDSQERVQYHYVLLDYLCHVREGDLVAASDASEAKWVPFQEIPSMNLPEAVRTVLKKAEKTGGKK